MRKTVVRCGALLPAALLAALAGCTTTPADTSRPVAASPQAGDVVLRARLLAPDGTPATGRPVVVTRRASVGDVALDLFTGVATLGVAVLPCLGGPSGSAALEACRTNGFTTSTTADGGFALRLRATDVRSRTGGLRSLVAASGLPPPAGATAGPTVAVTVRPNAAEVAVPPVRFWAAGTAERADADRLTLTWAASPGAPDARERLAVTDPGRGLVLTDERAASPEVVDPRLIEDAVPSVVVSATGRAGADQVVWTSERRAFRGTAGAPASRGRPCVATTGATPGPARAACWLDDGQFAAAEEHLQACAARTSPVPPASAPAVPLRCPTPPITAVAVDLGGPVPLALVVLRPGAPPGPITLPPAAVETSADAKTWRLIGTLDERSADGAADPIQVVPPAGVTARYLRLRATGPGDLGGYAELSAWPGEPASAPASGTLRLGEPPVGRSTGTPVGPVVAAALLIALLIAGLGYAAGSRGTPPQ